MQHQDETYEDQEVLNLILPCLASRFILCFLCFQQHGEWIPFNLGAPILETFSRFHWLHSLENATEMGQCCKAYFFFHFLWLISCWIARLHNLLRLRHYKVRASAISGCQFYGKKEGNDDISCSAVDIALTGGKQVTDPQILVPVTPPYILNSIFTSCIWAFQVCAGVKNDRLFSIRTGIY